MAAGFTRVFPVRLGIVTERKDIPAVAMHYENWTSSGHDRLRARRLAIGWAVGAALLSMAGGVLAWTSGPAPGVEEEEEPVLDVALAEEPPAPEPEPEPAAAPEPPPAQPAPRGPVMPKIAVPTEIPTAAAAEAAPSDNPYGGSFDPYQYAGTGTRSAAATPAVVEVKVAAVQPAAPARPSGPIRVTEETTPPGIVVQPPAPSFPSAAKSAGVSGRVSVKFVVTVAGLPDQVQAVAGPEPLRAACEDFVRQFRFSPAVDKASGQPVAVFQRRDCNFTLQAE